jgi:hypothetical protein
MRADKDSIDYQVNLVALQEMEEAVPMTLRERRCLRKWVYKGNEVESNLLTDMTNRDTAA